jgi:hypothetical protein
LKENIYLVGLSSEGKGKMRILLENLIGKIEDYLAEYDKEVKTVFLYFNLIT